MDRANRNAKETHCGKSRIMAAAHWKHGEENKRRKRPNPLVCRVTAATCVGLAATLFFLTPEAFAESGYIVGVDDGAEGWYTYVPTGDTLWVNGSKDGVGTGPTIAIVVKNSGSTTTYYILEIPDLPAGWHIYFSSGTHDSSSFDEVQFHLSGGETRTFIYACTDVPDSESSASCTLRLWWDRTWPLSNQLLETWPLALKADNTYPESSVWSPSPGSEVNSSFTVRWSGNDPGSAASGIRDYDVQYKAGGGPWTDWAMASISTSKTFSGGIAGQTYYFRCRARDRVSHEESYPSTYDTYVTVKSPPSKPTNPSPSHGASDVSINANLSWSNGGGATSYLVYFGTDSTPDSGEYQGEQGSTTFDPGTLNYSTTYYWRIDAKNSAGTTTGDVWRFTTESAPPWPTISRSPSSLSPSCTEGTDASFDSFSVWNSGTGTLSYSISDNVTWLSCSPTSGSSTGEWDTITVNYGTSGLSAAGSPYSATITISDPAATNSPQTVSVSLTVNPPGPSPTISRSPSSLSPSCTEGTDASSDSFSVWNSGTGTLTYSISDNVTWLSCSPTSGSSTGEWDTITVNYGTSGLSAAGSPYSATITISDPAATNSPQTVNVNLTVSPGGGGDAYEPDDSFGQAKPITDGETQSRSIHVAGNRDYVEFFLSEASDIVVETDGASGDTVVYLYDGSQTLMASDDDGGNGLFSLINAPGLPAGTYYIMVEDYGNNGTIAAYTLSLDATWVSSPIISRNPPSLSRSCIQGSNASSENFTVWNTGTGTLIYTISDDATWLSCSPTSGTSTGEPDTITVSFSTSGLSVGSHSATITISASGATNSPQTISVALTVSAEKSDDSCGCVLEAGSSAGGSLLAWAVIAAALVGVNRKRVCAR